MSSITTPESTRTAHTGQIADLLHLLGLAADYPLGTTVRLTGAAAVRNDRSETPELAGGFTLTIQEPATAATPR
jgi:hypothetical protein